MEEIVEYVPTEAEQKLTRHLEAAAFLGKSVAAAQCLQMGAIHRSVLAARRNPEVYVPETPSQTRTEMVRFAERAAVFDLAIRLSVSEHTIWGQFHDADILIRRLPKIWAEFRGGNVAYPNVRTAASVVVSVPDDPALSARLDELLVGKAARLTASKFRTAAAGIRERIHPTDPVVRHQAARVFRHVEYEPGKDGMEWFHLLTDASTVTKIDARLSAAATRQRKQPGEERTLAQLHADAAGDILTGQGTDLEVKARVQISVPVTALLNKPEVLGEAQTAPAVLDGYGPIDDATATLLAADAVSFRRVFTDPITGIDLSMGRHTYRPTAGQREWLRRKFRTCIGPGCARRAIESDLDHTTNWQFHGLTNDDNLAPIHRGHHTLKHKTRIQVKRKPDGGCIWTTPTGYTKDNDPPPF